MIKNILAISMVGMVMFSGCSSKPETTDEVAVEICEMYSDGNLEKIIEHASNYGVSKLSALTGEMKKRVIKDFQKQVKGIDCSTVKSKKGRSDNRFNIVKGDFKLRRSFTFDPSDKSYIINY
jgi:hypothetical protein